MELKKDRRIAFVVNRQYGFVMSEQQTSELNIEYIAELARLRLTAEEKQEFSQQLGEILQYFERLKTVDVSGVEPTAHAHPLYNVWAEDVPGAVLTPEEALMNAPAVRDNQVVVARIVDES